VVRIGGGSAGAEERIDAAVELAEKGKLDYLCFDSLSEVELSTIAIATRDDDSAKGYDAFAEERMTQVLPMAIRNGVKIIANLGGRDPLAAQRMLIEIARKAGLKGVKIAAVLGDDVLEDVRKLNLPTAEFGKNVRDFGDSLITAHAYIPADAIVQALSQGADMVVTGRVGDASLFLAPLMHEFGWRSDDWNRRASGIVVGHLLECAGQVTGGFFADPPYKVVPDIHRLGFPIAEVSESGEAIITKVDGSGGMVTPATVKEQLLYEVQDPFNYIEADVISDFGEMEIRQVGADRVMVSGVRGKPQPRQLKVSLGVLEGYMGAGTIYYGGPGALGRAKLAAESIKKRFEYLKLNPKKLEIFLLGVNGLFGSAPGTPASEPWEVGVRTAAITATRAEAVLVAREATTTLSNNGPAAVTCRQRQYELKEVVGYYHTFIDRDKINTSVSIQES
jgi:hypothetical protein